jgi:hypothetical protein
MKFFPHAPTGHPAKPRRPENLQLPPAARNLQAFEKLHGTPGKTNVRNVTEP